MAKQSEINEEDQDKIADTAIATTDKFLNLRNSITTLVKLSDGRIVSVRVGWAK